MFFTRLCLYRELWPRSGRQCEYIQENPVIAALAAGPKEKFREECLSHQVQRPKVEKSVNVKEERWFSWAVKGIRGWRECLEYRNGVARVVQLKTAAREVIRPIQRLYCTEVPMSNTEKLKKPESDCSVPHIKTSLTKHLSHLPPLLKL
jgi:hypothetical protein